MPDSMQSFAAARSPRTWTNRTSVSALLPCLHTGCSLHKPQPRPTQRVEPAKQVGIKQHTFRDPLFFLFLFLILVLFLFESFTLCTIVFFLAVALQANFLRLSKVLSSCKFRQ